ncbi:MAG: 1-hydroxycarotenoid 3,4-desaturase CrtD [Panacagrimonas sp.]
MAAARVVVIGAGVGGLVAALELAAQGLDVTVVERAASAGGKLREVEVGGVRIDAGPTVFTMRWVFEEIFAAAGLWFSDHVQLERATTLARHAWADGSHFDLHADLKQSADAIAAFAGPAEGRRYLEFAKRARDIYKTLEDPFIRSSCASPQALVRAVGSRGLGDLWRITPFENLWRGLGRHFHDSRLRQLFARYATYCGSSPFLAPATLMLVAHVEQDGVWLIRGGMHRLAQALASAAKSCGASFRFSTEAVEITTLHGRVSGVKLRTGEHLAADAVVINADSAAVSSGLFGPEAARATPPARGATRSLSAITWMLRAETEGFPLHRHNVFFSSDYPREFDDIFKRTQVPTEPTVYVCAQDRGAHDEHESGKPERLLCLINAPANGDIHPYDDAEIRSCEQRSFSLLERCGLILHRTPEWTQVMTPAGFNQMFPATGGALYGPASHGWMASFNRAGSRSRMPGLFLAGGSTHPGPGVPMAALSGRLAAASVMEDFASTGSFRAAAMPGGTSMR